MSKVSKPKPNKFLLDAGFQLVKNAGFAGDYYELELSMPTGKIKMQVTQETEKFLKSYADCCRAISALSFSAGEKSRQNDIDKANYEAKDALEAKRKLQAKLDAIEAIINPYQD